MVVVRVMVCGEIDTVITVVIMADSVTACTGKLIKSRTVTVISVIAVRCCIRCTVGLL